MPVREKSKVSAEQPPEPTKVVASAVSGQAASLPTGDVGEEKVLMQWRAPSRPFKKRDREYFTTIAAIAFLVIIILGFLREFLLIAVVIAFAFVSYVLASVQPEETEHQLTSRGIRTGDKLFRWNTLRRYWTTEKFGQKMVIIQTIVAFPGHLILLVGSAEEGKIRKVLNEHLPHEEPEKTFLDKSAEWLSKKIPLESKIS